MKSETNRLNQTEFDTDYNLLSNDKGKIRFSKHLHLTYKFSHNIVFFVNYLI